MKYFNLENELAERLRSATDVYQRLCARTDVCREIFEVRAKRAGLTVLRRGDGVTVEDGLLLVIGVATWSDSDMAVLDQVVDRAKARQIRTRVFDIDECRNFIDVLNFLPQIGFQVTKTPVFGYYVNGSLSAHGQGRDAIHWLDKI